MPSISSIMNVAKEALLAHQASISVTGHNIANVNTPGYSRQVATLTTSISTPEGSGNYGNGVEIEEVSRKYDQYLVQRLMNQSSAISNLEVKQQAMRVIETTFNELPGLAVNDLLSQFWESWQSLSNNPELSASRQTVAQQAELLNEQFNTMAADIVQNRYEIGVSLQSSIDDINALTTQLADLNVTITSSETPLQKQNDLRDSRDSMLGELADLIDIQFFESDNGAYTILLADGHALVETNEHWDLDWSGESLAWISTNSIGGKTSVNIGDNYDMGGKVGGLVEMRNSLIEGDPNNFLGQLDALANALIREVNQKHSQGVGLVSFTDRVSSSELANDSVLLHTTLDSSTGNDAITADTFTINDRKIGRIEGTITTNGLAMGKTSNAAQAINAAEAGVEARMTTLVAGSAVSGMADTESVSFTVNGISIAYTYDPTAGADAALTANQTASNVVAAINTAITNYNNNVGVTAPQKNIPKVTIEAVVGTGLNGGVVDSIILRNTNKGDQSEIVIADLATTSPESKMGLTNGIYVADATHNTGALSLFARQDPLVIEGGADDTYLTHLGWNVDGSSDGQLTYNKTDNKVVNSLMGLSYADTLVTDNTSFELWIYNTDGSLALAQPVSVSMERAYDLQDVADSINLSIVNAIDNAAITTPWIEATVSGNQLVLTPDSSHNFAFGADTSNFLAASGINTFFTGHNSRTIAINSTVSQNLNKVAAGKINQYGEIFTGDNSNALLLSNIQRDETVTFTDGSTDTLDGFYNSLIGKIGVTGRSVNTDLEYSQLVSNQLDELRDSTSGVSLDEEMANLIRFQHAYSAAAKLISTGDEMLETLLNTF